MKNKYAKPKAKHLKYSTVTVLLMFLDCMIIIVSMTGALWVRFDFSFTDIEPVFMNSVAIYMGIHLILSLIIFAFCRMYTTLWRFASVKELKYTIIAVIASTAEMVVGMRIMGLKVPRSFPLMYGFIAALLLIISRFSYRFMKIFASNRRNFRNVDPVRTMVIGAGSAGYMIVREMENSKHLNRAVACIIDDDPKKRGSLMQGVPIVGGRDKIPDKVEEYAIEEIIVAIPTLSKKEQRDLLEICQQTNCKVKILPGIYQLVKEEVSVSQLRDVQIEDLLGREPVDLKMPELTDFIKGKTVLVTGGGGSIGSEICRQLAMHDPESLIIFDIYENNAYEIQLELRKKYPDLNLQTLIGSVRDQVRVDQVFETYHPDLVFHAAAHKHVPLMEDSPLEAIKNNVYGTYIVASAADRYHAKKMILISTDKAVRPTNVMGASKRMCEMVIQSFACSSQTEYAAVRFGNVLGSNGSVIPIFRKQIEDGGPVTVTHPDIIRYFMTIPEAVNLVLQCGIHAHRGEIFILDMGEPVRILDLAKNMIKLSGLTPGLDIEIQFSGLRPGEKLYEELLINDKNLVPTDNKRIMVAQMGDMDGEKTMAQIKSLIDQAFAGNCSIHEEIQKIVPEYSVPRQNYIGARAARAEAEAAASASTYKRLSNYETDLESAAGK